MNNKLSYIHPLKSKCTQFLSRHQPISSKEHLANLANSKYAEYDMDFYGHGELLQILEQRIADLLGKESALFCHKGMLGQLSAIKHWTSLNESNRIAFQPDCHMDFDEQDAYRDLFGFEAEVIGSNNRPLLNEDITLSSPVSVVSIELPHRRAGFLLPEWDTLLALKNFCEKLDTALHFDGARLFEAAPYWNKTPAEVSALCDTVYVSSYKLFGALAGGTVAGSKDTIDAIKPWKARMSGDVHTLFPYAISAMEGLDKYLPRINDFINRAGEVAGIVKSVLGEDALPHKIQCNSFVVDLPISPEETAKRALVIAEKQRKWLFDGVTALPEGNSRVEVQIGDAIDQWSDDEIRSCFNSFFKYD